MAERCYFSENKKNLKVLIQSIYMENYYNEKNELTRVDTKSLKGIAILMMLCLHLFDRDYTNLYQPLLYLDNVPISYYLGQISDCCVVLYAFCSGYGHYITSGKQGAYKRRLRGLVFL